MRTKITHERKLKVVCVFLLSILFVISGVFITNKCVFSREEASDFENTDISKETETLTISESDVVTNESSNRGSKKVQNENLNTGIVFAAQKSASGLIEPKEEDYRVIPDKYNTGVHGELLELPEDFTISGIQLRNSSDKIVFDFYYCNKNASGTYVIENYDFSGYDVGFYHADKMKDKKIEIIFNNCKFTTITAGRASHSDVFAFTFNNCTINRFYGSDSTFNRCYFGDSFRDGLVPFANITVNDCYFANLASNDPKGNGGHSDGTQLYGHADTMVEDVLFSNCRFEIPYVKTTQSTAYVNACIMLSLEYNNGKNIKFEDCLVNGGGYSIYAGKAYEDLTLTDVYFTNIKIGAAKMYGNIYPAVDKNVVFTNVEDQDSLYVSSVWNDGANTHIIVSNDTAEERILRIVTGSGYKDFTIKPCLGGNDLRYDNFDLPFEEFPFDIDITIGDKADYVICFDVTDGGEKQIRYVSFNGKPTYYNVNTGDTFPNDPEVDITKIIAEGDCGRNITFTLDSTGKLKLDGTGNMYNYSSNKSAPWFDYADSIVSVEISEGITVIGAQAFRGLKNVESIELPRSLTTIGANVFIGCYGLKTIHIHSAVTVIGDFAFHATRVEKCVYYGTEKMWNDIKIGKKNDYLLSSEKVFKNEKS